GGGLGVGGRGIGFFLCELFGRCGRWLRRCNSRRGREFGILVGFLGGGGRGRLRRGFGGLPLRILEHEGLHRFLRFGLGRRFVRSQGQRRDGQSDEQRTSDEEWAVHDA